MKPTDKVIAKIAKENADAAWKLFFEDGHSIADYEFCEKVIEAAMAHFNVSRSYEELEDDDS